MKAALSLALASAVMAQEAVPVGPANAATLAIGSTTAGPSNDFLTGYFGTINTVAANSDRPTGAVALPLLPGVNEILLPVGAAVASAPAGLLKGYFNAVGNLLGNVTDGESVIGQYSSAAAGSIPSIPSVPVGSTIGPPVAFPIVVPDLLAPIGTLYNILTGVNETKPLFVTLEIPSYDPVAYYNSWPVPVKGTFQAGDKLGRGVSNAFTALLQGFGGAVTSIFQGTGTASVAVLEGGAAAARDLTTAGTIGLQQALNTLPRGSYAIPVAVAAPVGSIPVVTAAAAPAVAKRFVA